MIIIIYLLAIRFHTTHALEYTVKGKTTYAYSPLASFGKVPFKSGQTHTLGQAAPFDMCNPISDSLKPLVRGKSLLVQRGGCSFVRKACMAQQAGAASVVVYNSFQTDSTSNGQPEQPTSDVQITPINYPIHMFGISNDITIPIVMVSSRNGIILNQLIMHGGSKVILNITTESPPTECGGKPKKNKTMKRNNVVYIKNMTALSYKIERSIKHPTQEF